MSTWGMVSLTQEVPTDPTPGPAAWSSSVRQPEPSTEVCWKKGASGDPETGNVLHARNVLLHGLEQTYILESPSEVRQFLRVRPTVIALFVEAAARIDAAFGKERIKAIRLVHESNATSVFGIVFWPESVQSGKEALARFDQGWWLGNCNRAGGIVNFNIELV